MIDDDLKILGQRLKELRNERQLTIEMLVDDLKNKYDVGINRGVISKWENGVNIPSLRHVAVLCKYYGVSLDYMIGNTDCRVPVDLLAKGKKK